MNNVFVYCEIEKTTVAEVSQELLTKGRKLANELGVDLEAVVAGTGIKGKVEDQILPYGVDKLYVFDGEGLFPYTSKTSHGYPRKPLQGGEPADSPSRSYGHRTRPRTTRVVITDKWSHCRLHPAGDWRIRRQEKRQALRPSALPDTPGIRW